MSVFERVARFSDRMFDRMRHRRAFAITEEMGEEAIGPLLMEVTLTLQAHPYRGRILAISTRR